MVEKWKKLDGFEDIEISNFGNARSRTRNIHVYIIKHIDKMKKILNFANRGYRESLYMHILVAKLFCKGHGKYVIPKDGDYTNTSYTNLYFSDGRGKGTGRRYRRCRQYKSDGTFIKEYNSLKEAGKCTGVASSRICACCLGKIDLVGGYKWEYVESNKDK